MILGKAVPALCLGGHLQQPMLRYANMRPKVEFAAKVLSVLGRVTE